MGAEHAHAKPWAWHPDSSAPALARRAHILQAQDVLHRIPPRGFAGQELGRLEGAADVAVAGVGAVGQLQRLAERAEDDRVLADVVADADGVDADLMCRAFADESLAAVTQFGLAHGVLDDLGEV